MKWWHWVLIVVAAIALSVLVLHFTGVLTTITGSLFVGSSSASSDTESESVPDSTVDDSTGGEA